MTITLQQKLTTPTENIKFDTYASAPNDAVFDPNFVIEFARVRMDQVNGWLNRELNVMRRCGAQTTAVNEALQKVAEYSEGFDDATKLANLRKALTDAAATLPDGDPVKEKLNNLASDPNSVINQGGDNNVLKEEMAALQSDLETTLKKVDQTSQENQLEVNQKMGERGEIMQLASMLIQQMNETTKNILGRS